MTRLHGSASKPRLCAGMLMKSQRGTEYRNDRHACRHKLSSKPAAAVVADLPMGIGSRRECLQDVQKFAVHNKHLPEPRCKREGHQTLGQCMERESPVSGTHGHTINLQNTRTEQSAFEQQESSLGVAGVWRSCRGDQEKGRGVVRRMRVTQWILSRKLVAPKRLRSLC